MAFPKKKDDKEKKPEIRILTISNIELLRGSINDLCKSQVSMPAVDRPVIIVSTGILSMDLAVGNGGLLGGRIVDTWGEVATGKTLLAMTVGGYIQRCYKQHDGKEVSKIVAFLDAEGTFMVKFAQSAGMDTDTLLLVRSTTDKILAGEDYFEIIIKLVQANVDYVIVDSCPALVPRAVILNQFGLAQKATTASLMSEGLKMLTPILNSSSNSIVHFINQIRGRPMHAQWEAAMAPTGGEALKYYSSYRLEVWASEPIIKKILLADGTYQSRRVGVRAGIRLYKNKTTTLPEMLPGKSYHFEYDVYFIEHQDEDGLVFGRGVDVIKDYVDTGVRTGVIKQRSSWFSFGSINENGQVALTKAIRSQPAIMAEIRNEVFDAFKAQAAAEPVAPSQVVNATEKLKVTDKKSAMKQPTAN